MSDDASLPHVELGDAPKVADASKISNEAPKSSFNINISGDACSCCALTSWVLGWTALIVATCIFGFMGFSVEPFTWTNFYLVGVLGIVEQLVVCLVFVVRNGDKAVEYFCLLPLAWCVATVNALFIHFLGYLVELVVQRDSSRLDPWTYSAGTAVCTSLTLCCGCMMFMCLVVCS